MTLKTKLVVFF